MTDLHKLHLGLQTHIAKAAAFMRQEAANFSRERVEVKGLNDLVSYVDKTAEEMLVAGCTQLLPGSGFIPGGGR